MSENTDSTVSVLDENMRRYYLDVMGVQCWQLRDGEQKVSEPEVAVGSAENLQAPSSPDLPTTDLAPSVDEGATLTVSIQHCTRCQLHQTRKQAIPGEGNESAKLMFVLLSPDAAADSLGRLCHGEERELFSKMLSAINISIDDVYITSLLKCSVPDTHTISPQEIQSCHGFLEQQVTQIRPDIVVVLGETAVRCLLQKNLSLDDFRALNADSIHQIASVPVFSSYSPAELLRQPEHKRKAWSDLQQLQKITGT